MRVSTIPIIGLAIASAQGQSFEAATIRPAAPATGGGRVSASGDRIVFSNTTLLNVLVRAYGLTFAGQVAGPSWVFTERYDIIAKAPDGTPKEQIPRMLQNFLLERFKLMLHHETKDLPVYDLVTGKGRLKLKKSGETAVKNDWAMEGDHRLAKSMNLATLATYLTLMLGARTPVRDKTGLEGYYDFPFDLTKEETTRDSAPSIFSVVDDLGLYLESRKAPFDVVVIDSGNRQPTEN
jgi:uncharacterized protein (TIGR03435 family)